MRLFELTGVKKYKERGLWDVIHDYEAAGGKWLGNGRYANVIGMPGRDYVWKFFPDDRCYIAFVRWAMRNPDPSLPHFLSKPRWIVPFYRRPKTEAKLCIVKMERLSPWTPPAEIKSDIGWFLESIALSGHFEPDQPVPESMRDQRVHRAKWEADNAILRAHPELIPLARFFLKLSGAPINCSLDIHKANIMQRDDGSLVFTDPFWPGESPYQAYQRVIADAGMVDDDWDDEYDFATDPEMVSGGELPKKAKPKKEKAPSWTDSDMPF